MELPFPEDEDEPIEGQIKFDDEFTDVLVYFRGEWITIQKYYNDRKNN